VKQVDLLNPSSAENFLQGARNIDLSYTFFRSKNFEQLDIQLAILQAMQPARQH
jgi:hypothetical protein